MMRIRTIPDHEADLYCLKGPYPGQDPYPGPPGHGPALEPFDWPLTELTVFTMLQLSSGVPSHEETQK